MSDWLKKLGEADLTRPMNTPSPGVVSSPDFEFWLALHVKRCKLKLAKSTLGL